MGPINYGAAFAGPDPSESFLSGFKQAAGIKAVMDQREQQAAAQAAQQAMQADLQALTSNPNAGPREYAAMTVKYPQLREQFKQAADMMGTEQKRGEMSFTTQTYSALLSGRPDLAETMLRDRAAAMRNSGAPEQEVKAQEMWADLIKTSPEQARHIGGLMLSGVMGPDKFAETFGKLGAEQRAAEQAPATLAKLEADAKTAGVNAKFAEQQAVLDLQKKGWDIKAIQEDIGFKKEANRIAAMRASFEKEANSLKREELGIKLQEARNALDGKVREKVAVAESGAASIDNMLNTIERVKGNKSLNDVLGTIEGRMPAVFSDESADAIALIDTLGSQAFLAQIPNIKGMGALSNAEGEKLQSAFQNLTRTQSEEQFRRNLDEAARLLKKGREGLSRSTGVPLPKPDTPAAPGSRPPLSSFDNGQSGQRSP
jgi:hypothetical protein